MFVLLYFIVILHVTDVKHFLIYQYVHKMENERE